MKSICVYLGANSGTSAELPKIVMELGKELANRGIRLIYGGSSLGLMGTLAQSVMTNGGEVTGIIPKCLLGKEKPQKNLTKILITETMQERKLLMQQHSNAFLVMPGGLGTLEEAIETWNAIKIGILDKPIAFFNLDAYFDGLFSFIKHCEQKGFLSSTQRKIPICRSDLKILLDTLLETTLEEA